MGGINEEAVAAALAKIGLTIDEASTLLDNEYTPSQIVTMSSAEHQAALQSVNGGWKVIARADSPEDLKKATPSVSEIPSGTIGIVTVELPWYVGGSVTAKIFDMAGAEQTLGNYLKPAHSEVVDVYEEGGKGYVKFRVTGSPALPIIIAIGAGLIALGITIAIITVAIKAPEALQDAASFLNPEKWGDAALKFIPIVLIGGAAVYLITSGGNRNAKQSSE